MSEDTKTCPFCAETIKAAAIVCKHCGRNLPAAGEPPSPAVGAVTISTVQQPPKRTLRKLLIGIAVLTAAFFSLPYMCSSPQERAAISARANCERVFPAERGRACDQVYRDVLNGKKAGGDQCPADYPDCSWGR